MKDEISTVCCAFSQSTSSHGIPLIAGSKSSYGRRFWTLLFLGCLATAIVQAYFLIEKFTRFESMTQIKIKFEPAPFPAVTVCNMNPYKNSMLHTVGNVKKSLNVYDHIRSESTGNGHVPPNINQIQKLLRKRRFLQWSQEPFSYDPPEGSRFSRTTNMYEPVTSHCECPNMNEDCVPLLQELATSVMCTCFRDVKTNTVWPCYHATKWMHSFCEKCTSRGRCDYPAFNTRDFATLNLSHYSPQPCLCELVHQTCVVKSIVIPMHGEIATTTPDPKFVKQLGFQDMTDKAALNSKAQETIMYEMANVEMEKRINISYSINDLIYNCAFDQKSCDMVEDFKLRVTPNFGNCYTFNHQWNTNRSSSRPGPIYGLRFLAYANISDYMSTTESAGFRLAIHLPDEYPFPDTIGYNAPTGIISSFALKLKKITRLPSPYGDCRAEGYRPDQYIYEERYNIEGCYRSCFQNTIIRTCNCGDPNFPKPYSNVSYCHLSNPQEKRCVDKVADENRGSKGMDDCGCKQPCETSMYIITYSAARWPSAMYDTTQCRESDQACLLDYRTNAGFLEIYYEQSNFDIAEERESYGVTSLMADFGGQLGLWMGFSVITIIEWSILIFKLVTICCRKRPSTTRSSPPGSVRTPTKEDAEAAKRLTDLYKAKQMT